jgi:hypothetical protein
MRNLTRGQSFRLGDDALAELPIPDGLEMSPIPVRAAQGGWELDARGALGGTLTLRGRPEDPAALARTGAPVPVMPGDYGLLQYGQLAIFFQYVTAASSLPSLGGTEPLSWLAVFSSSVFHIGVLGLIRTLMTPPPIPKPIELTNPDELASRFGLKRAMIEEPPPPTPGADDKGGQGVKDPGNRDKPDKGAKMPNPEGKLGVKGPHDKAEVPGEVRKGTHIGGLTEVLDGETGKEIKSTLKSIESVSGALSGLNSTNIVLGGGPGTGLKGTGSGGGGTSMGVPYGAGGLTTGLGTGGAGGAGTGGNGTGGSGGGSSGGTGSGSGAPGEAKVSVTAGAAAAKGGLSPEQIRRVVIAHTGAVRACYETEAQKNPGLKGGMTLSWQIEPSGSVSGVSVAGSTLGNPRVEGCVSRQVKSWRFPASDSSTTVGAFPFKFGVGG